LVIVALRGGGQAEQYLRDLGYRVILLHINQHIPSWQCFNTLRALFRAERPDVVHTCGAEANFHGQLAAFFAGVKSRVSEEIGIPGHSRKAQFIFRMVYRFTNHMIAISEAVKRYLIEHELPPRKVSVVYNPIDTEFGSSIVPERSHNTLRISCLCRLTHIKNLFMLIDLLEALKTRHVDRSFELWLIGDGEERENLRKHAFEKGLDDMVKFAGFVAKPQGLLLQTDLFILPSFYEGFGLACIEAIQCGLPVIVSNSGGMTEYITDGVHGFLFDPKSFQQLLEKVDRVLAMSERERLELTRRAHERINELFSPQRYLDELLAIYKKQPKHTRQESGV